MGRQTMGKRVRLTSDQRKSQILKKATELFSKYGFEKMTIGRLAAECNITEPALYRYFPSKKRLYAEVLKALRMKINVEKLADQVERIDDVEEALFAVGKAINHTYTSNPEISRLLLYCSLEGHSLTTQVFNIIRAPYTDILEKALGRFMRQGVMHKIDPAITARCFIGMVTECAMGARLWKKAQGANCDPGKNMKNTIPIFARGLKNKT